MSQTGFNHKILQYRADDSSAMPKAVLSPNHAISSPFGV